MTRIGLVLLLATGTLPAQQLRITPEQPNNLYAGAGRLSGAYGLYSRNIGKVVLGASYLESRSEKYHEYQLGAGFDFERGNLGCTPFLGVTKATDAWYLQPWAAPWWEKGRIMTYGYVGAYFPVQETGRFQFFLDSATLLYKLGGRFAAGASYSMEYQAGSATRHALGPAIRFDLNKVATTVEFHQGFRRTGGEIRVTFQSSF